MPPMLATCGLASLTVMSSSFWRVSEPPSFITPEPSLLVCEIYQPRTAGLQCQTSSHSMTVDVSLYDALRPLDFSCTSTTWMESQQPLIFFEPSPTALPRWAAPPPHWPARESP